MMSGMNGSNTRAARIRKRIMAVVASTFGVLALLVGTLGTVVAVHLLVTGSRTTAVVGAVDTSRKNPNYLLEFTLADGTPVQAWTGAVGSSQVGDKVLVLYDPADPVDWVVSPGYETEQTWIPLLVCLVVAGGLFLSGGQPGGGPAALLSLSP